MLFQNVSIIKMADLADLLFFWYRDLNPFRAQSSMKVYELWTEIWFAKDNKQRIIDERIQGFQTSIDDCIEYQPHNDHERLALVILYDQVPRNTYRGSAEAYAYDGLARKHCDALLSKFSVYPLQVQLTLLICLIHSESMVVHITAQELLREVVSSKYIESSIKVSMTKIVFDHRERIQLFGRIPERNKLLGRATSIEEQAYLEQAI